MNIKVADLMVSNVVTSHSHKSIGHIKDIMRRNRIHSLPLVTSENEVEGIVTIHDFNDEISNETQVRLIMTKKVFTIPKYSGIHIAARIMRNHHIHHLIVTHEKRIVGVLSSFDLIALIEDHRFVMKNAPTRTKKKKRRV